MRRIVAVLIFLAPARLRGLLGRRLLGWDVHPTAHIGRSLIDARTVVLGAGSSVGPWNVIRNLDELRLAAGASIASRNRIACPAVAGQVFAHVRNRRAAVVLGRDAMITEGHEIDCSDLFELGDYARLAGFRSQVLTHSLDLVRDRWTTNPVIVGELSAVMSGCILQSGTRVPARSIVSAGSVVTTKLKAELTFYRGNPAQAVRTLPDTLAYFRRDGRD